MWLIDSNKSQGRTECDYWQCCWKSKYCNKIRPDGQKSGTCRLAHYGNCLFGNPDKEVLTVFASWDVCGQTTQKGRKARNYICQSMRWKKRMLRLSRYRWKIRYENVRVNSSSNLGNKHYTRQTHMKDGSNWLWLSQLLKEFVAHASNYGTVERYNIQKVP